MCTFAASRFSFLKIRPLSPFVDTTSSMVRDFPLQDLQFRIMKAAWRSLKDTADRLVDLAMPQICELRERWTSACISNPHDPSKGVPIGQSVVGRRLRQSS